MKQLFWDVVPIGRLSGTFWVEGLSSPSGGGGGSQGGGRAGGDHGGTSSARGVGGTGVDDDDVQLDFSALEDHFAQVGYVFLSFWSFKYTEWFLDKWSRLHVARLRLATRQTSFGCSM